MEDREPGARRRAALLLVALGLLVAIVVATASVASGVLFCGDDLAGECHALVRTLSLRAGLVAGAASILMLLFVLGLSRMVALDEERRAYVEKPEPL